MHHHLCVERDRAGLELDEFLALSFPRVAKRFLRRKVRSGEVLVDGGPARPGQRVRTDQVISLDFDEDELPERPDPSREVVPVQVLFEDGHVLAVDKPADLAVEPDRWDTTRPNLVDSLLCLADERAALAEGFRPRLLHRLDRGTSGVVLFARTLEGERALRAAFDERRVTKRYTALVEGELRLEAGEELRIEHAIGPDPRKSGRMVAYPAAAPDADAADAEPPVVPAKRNKARKQALDAKAALTIVRTVENYRGYTLLDCEPRTGRTHQLRVHLAEEGFPLAVDPLYGRRDALYLSELKAGYRPKRGLPEPPLIRRLTLHAAAITFPRDYPGGGGSELTIEAPRGRDFDRVLKQLAKVRPLRR